MNIGEITIEELIATIKKFKRRKPKPVPPPNADDYGVTIDVKAYPNQCGMGKMKAIAPHVPRLLSTPGVKRMILDKINKMFPICVQTKPTVSTRIVSFVTKSYLTQVLLQ